MPPENQGFWGRYLPVTAWLPRYQGVWLKTDVVAGLSVWAVTVPSAMAYAGLAGVPVEYGLYTACLACLAYALFGTSRQLVVGPEAAAAAISAATVAPLAGGDPGRYLALTTALALLVGTLFVLGGLLRFGFISKLFARPVIGAFVVGLAVFIAVEQLGKLFGVTVEGSNSFEKLGNLLAQAGGWSWATMAVSAACLLALFLIHRYLRRVPAALTVMVASIIVSYAAGLGEHGVKLVGSIPSGPPSLGLPDVSLNDLVSMLPGALGFLLVAYSSSYSIAKGFAVRGHYELSGDQEMIALGVANLASGLFGGFVAQGSLSKTAANEQAGGRTELVSLEGSLLIFLTLILLTGFFKYLPSATLGAIVVFAVSEVMDFHIFARLRRAKIDDIALALAAFFGVLLFGVMEGILIGVVLSLAAFVRRASQPHVAVLGVDSSGIRFGDLEIHEDFSPVAGDVLIYRFDAPFIFSNAEAFADQVLDLAHRADPPLRTLIIDCEMMFDMDTTATDVFRELHAHLREEGIEVMLARVHAPVLAFMRRDGVVDLVGEENVFLTNYDAVEEYRRRRAQA